MWLINANTLMLKEFFDDEIPPYNILSHTWDREGEVTFQDMQSGIAPTKPGYHKILNTCQLTLQSQNDRTVCAWVWIDSCCIDKTSSAYLSEAINSMYQYYKCASTCFVYLGDMKAPSTKIISDHIRHCRWFTRSWTLQELIAPSSVIFFDQDWHHIGTKDELSGSLVEVTRINIKALRSSKDLSIFSVAQKMSWAARRTATRQEDVAYSLLGIFGVNMPLLYGEGNRAFLRLQEEIMKQSDDHSLFAWGSPALFGMDAARSPAHLGTGFLASSPADFGQGSDVVSYTTEADQIWTMTNKGIQVTLPTIRIQNRFAFVLNCYRTYDLEFRFVIYSRVDPHNPKLYRRENVGLYNRVFLEKNLETGREYFWERTIQRPRAQNDRAAGILVKLNFESLGHIIMAATPRKLWSQELRMFRPPSDNREWFAHVHFTHFNPDQSYLLFVFIACGSAYVDIIDAGEHTLRRGDAYESEAQLLDAIDIFYNWKDISKDPGQALSARSTVGLGTAHRLEASVTTENVLGQSMFVVEVSKADGAVKQPSSLVSSLKRLGFR